MVLEAENGDAGLWESGSCCASVAEIDLETFPTLISHRKLQSGFLCLSCFAPLFVGPPSGNGRLSNMEPNESQMVTLEELLQTRSSQ